MTTSDRITDWLHDHRKLVLLLWTLAVLPCCYFGPALLWHTTFTWNLPSKLQRALWRVLSPSGACSPSALSEHLLARRAQRQRVRCQVCSLLTSQPAHVENSPSYVAQKEFEHLFPTNVLESDFAVMTRAHNISASHYQTVVDDPNVKNFTLTLDKWIAVSEHQPATFRLTLDPTTGRMYQAQLDSIANYQLLYFQRVGREKRSCRRGRRNTRRKVC